jgi:hypothetical protein
MSCRSERLTANVTISFMAIQRYHDLTDYYKANPRTNCWIWSRANSVKTNGAYGNYNGVPAHRLVYELYEGAIPRGFELDHLCRTTLCVNPEHLEPVRHYENVMRGRISLRTRGKCTRGHTFNEINFKKRKEGWWRCLVCMKEDNN